MKETALSADLLAVFVAVAEAESFSRAATRLGVSKGTVSRSIARLEASVGAELLHRTTHEVALSTAGTALYERVAVHVRALASAVTHLPERSEEPSGLLRLTAPLDFGATVLPEWVARFSMLHPAVRFDVRLTNAKVDLVAEGFDLAIRAAPGRLQDSTLTARWLCRPSIGFYAAPSYLARRGEPRHVGDPAHEWVVFGPLRAILKAPPSFVPRVVTDEFTFLRALLVSGAGVGALGTFLAAPLVAQGLLVPVLQRVAQPPARGGFYLVYPSSGQVPRKVTAFRDFVLAALESQPLA